MQLAASRLPRRARRAPFQPHVAARPGRAVGRFEAQALRPHRGATAAALPAHTRGERLQRQRLQPRAQQCIDIARRQIAQHPGGRSARHVRPESQRRAALPQLGALLQAQVLRRAQIDGQAGHVQPRHIGVERAVPGLPGTGVALQQRTAELPAQHEAVAQVRGRRGVQPQLVVAQAVAHHDQHVAQRHRLAAAQLVHPAHAAAAHHQLGLREHPVGRLGVGLRVAGEIEAGHLPAAGAGAPHLQLRPVQHQLLQPAAQQRGHRERRHGAGDVQAGLSAGTRQHQVAHGDRRHQAVGARLQRADAHRHPERVAGHLLQARTEFVDSRHNDPVQRAPRQHQRHGKAEHDPQGAANQSGQEFERAKNQVAALKTKRFRQPEHTAPADAAPERLEKL